MLQKVELLVRERVKQPRKVPFWRWGWILLTPLSPVRASDCWRPRTLHGATHEAIHNIARTLQAATPLNYAYATQAYDGRQRPLVVTLPPHR